MFYLPLFEYDLIHAIQIQFCNVALRNCDSVIRRTFRVNSDWLNAALESSLCHCAIIEPVRIDTERSENHTVTQLTGQTT